MSSAANIGASLDATQRPRSPLLRRVRVLWTRPLFGLSVVILAFLTVIAIAGPSLQPYDPEALTPDRLVGPSSEHWFGTDALGRDILSRVMAGARLSLVIGLGASLAGTFFGALIGGYTGYFGGVIDMAVQRIIDSLQAFPTIVLALALVAAFGSSPQNVAIIATMVFIPPAARVVRASVLEVRSLEFVTAARSLGAGEMRVLFRHVAPQTLAPIIVLVSLSVGQAILLESGLSFLGVGPPPPSVSWGRMIGGDARLFIEAAPWALLAPSAFLVLVVYAFNLLGDSLRDMLDPRLRGR